MTGWIELTAEDGHSFKAYRADPDGAAKGGIVVVQEIFGVNAHIQEVCQRFAAQGYLAVAPALFDRVERDVDLPYDARGVEAGKDLKTKAHLDDVMKDVAAARAVAAEGGKTAIVGYCWGGLVAWVAAAELEGFAAAVGYYGGGTAAHKALQPHCPVQLHFGEEDHAIPLSEVDELRAAHPDIPIHVYAGAGHGFSCDHRGSYNAEASALAMDRVRAFLDEHLH